MDPDWVENLNSVLDDKKLLTLPNGERVALSPNVRLFSVGDVCTCMCVCVCVCVCVEGGGAVWVKLVCR